MSWRLLVHHITLDKKFFRTRGSHLCFFAAEANIAATNPSVSEAAAAAVAGVKSDEALPVA